MESIFHSVHSIVQNLPARLVKIILVGDAHVGKTSFLLRYINNEFSDTVSTIGVDYKLKNIHHGGRAFKLQIWDTAGQERFRTVSSAYYRGAHGVILMYDINNERSFKNLASHWIPEVVRHTFEGVSLMLVGNKVDVTAPPMIEQEQARVFASQMGMLFYETSAKTGTNVQHAVAHLLESILQKGLLDENLPRNERIRTPTLYTSMDVDDEVQDVIVLNSSPRSRSGTSSSSHSVAPSCCGGGSMEAVQGYAELAKAGIEVEWEPDDATSSCRNCDQHFSRILRRHHCRWCGRLFCNRCSDNFIKWEDFPVVIIPNRVDSKPKKMKKMRVCNPCHRWIQNTTLIVERKTEVTRPSSRRNSQKMENVSAVPTMSISIPEPEEQSDAVQEYKFVPSSLPNENTASSSTLSKGKRLRIGIGRTPSLEAPQQDTNKALKRSQSVGVISRSRARDEEEDSELTPPSIEVQSMDTEDETEEPHSTKIRSRSNSIIITIREELTESQGWDEIPGESVRLEVPKRLSRNLSFEEQSQIREIFKRSMQGIEEEESTDSDEEEAEEDDTCYLQVPELDEGNSSTSEDDDYALEELREKTGWKKATLRGLRQTKRS